MADTGLKPIAEKKPEAAKPAEAPKAPEAAKPAEAPKAPEAPPAPEKSKGEAGNGQPEASAPATAPVAPAQPTDTAHHPKAPVLVHGGEVRSDSATKRTAANNAQGFRNSVKVSPAVNSAAQNQHAKVKKV